MCGYDIRPIRVVWSNQDGEGNVGLRGLHKVLTQDAALWLVMLSGLKDWEYGPMCSELWGPLQPYKPSQWAHLAEVGWSGCEDGGSGGRWEVGRQRRLRRKGTGQAPPPTPPPLQARPPLPQET